MTSTPMTINRLVVDPAIGGDLRARLAQDPQGGLKQAAKQFEGMLLSMMLKSMRDATRGDGLLDSQQGQFFTAIGDQQLAMNLASQSPLGFATMIEKQLARQGVDLSKAASTSLDALPRSLVSPSTTKNLPHRPEAGARRFLEANPAEATSSAVGDTPSKARRFVDRVWPHAVEAAATTGVPAHFLVAHSALESGWGKSEIKGADGSPSFNLFGVKAGRGWTGPTVEVQTTEFVNGVAQSVRAKFRAYGSYAEAFRDYAGILASKPRFAAVIGEQDGTKFARSLQQAGYATDPMYANKLARIINGPTLRQALAG
ncbi:MAG TPA: flagellar assembly peptidoglycan hydrolase FlgJ [Accumulibacter sp.]|nr:flagellar assembly peptidoglycan hydrolase FlgJ [Accumulibacter sp.]HQC79397.1 flagellar assembly peptidoglycan hydrolase FlgJ [Accumulibacter sp.]